MRIVPEIIKTSSKMHIYKMDSKSLVMAEKHNLDELKLIIRTRTPNDYFSMLVTSTVSFRGGKRKNDLSSIHETLYKSPRQVMNSGGGAGSIPGQ